jgi:hypothetical protein
LRENRITRIPFVGEKLPPELEGYETSDLPVTYEADLFPSKCKELRSRSSELPARWTSIEDMVDWFLID